MPTDLTKQVEEALSIVFEAGRSVCTVHALLLAMAKQIEANEDEIQRLAKLVEP